MVGKYIVLKRSFLDVNDENNPCWYTTAHGEVLETLLDAMAAIALDKEEDLLAAQQLNCEFNPEDWQYHVAQIIV